MTKDKDGKKRSERASRATFREPFNWDRSTSEPDLSENLPPLERWTKIFPHEYISVDELKFFRRRKPTDFHTRSSICLFDKDEPVLPFSSLKTEYRRRYKNPVYPIFRPNLTRKSTSLKLEGSVEKESEQKSKYIAYSREEISKSKPTAVKSVENLTLSGEQHYSPEYRSQFIFRPSPVERVKMPDGLEIDKVFEPDLNLNEQKTTTETEKLPYMGEPAVKIDPPKCHLKLEGEMSYVPEYRSQFVQFPIEKSHSIPQLSNIKFQGSFIGIPEYRESYKFHDNYSKSAPIKKADHRITFQGEVRATPEYSEKFKEPDKSEMDKAVSLKTEDHLDAKGEFSKNVPEYYESFKDPKITEMPERGKCREPYLRLKGKIEFNPEYRSTYLDFPRSRPITKKSTTSIRLSNSSAKQFGTPKKKFQPESSTRFHDSNLEDTPVTCQPEYRKAKRDYMIKERPLARKITEGDATPKNVVKSCVGSPELDMKKAASGGTRSGGRKKRSPRSPRKIGASSGTLPQFKLTLEGDGDIGGTFKKASPKFGRRASISRNAHNSRTRTTVVEGNSKYVKGSVDFTSGQQRKYGDPSFVVLNEPCKKSAWMKKSWYEA